MTPDLACPIVENQPVTRESIDPATLLTRAGAITVRSGLVIVLLWIGGMKTTAYEAEGIRAFVENSALFAWTYAVFGVQGLSNLLGAVEIAVALLIAARPIAPKVSTFGSLLAVGMFLSTLSFLITTPGAWVSELGGFPVISITGQFLLKDVVLLGAALWTAGEAWQAAKACKHCQAH